MGELHYLGAKRLRIDADLGRSESMTTILKLTPVISRTID
jgi:hypothetical protein